MAIEYTRKEQYNIDDLLEIMRLLRTPEGCPWDRAQTHKSVRGDFLEETHEAIEAIDRDDMEGLQEELGDVLLQVVFHTCMEEEAGGFTFSDVVNGLCQKLIARHPHVFGDASASDAVQALENWDAIKRKAKNGRRQTQLLDGVPHSLPALMRASKVLGRARRVGFETAPDAAAAVSEVTQAASVFAQAAEQEDASAGQALGDLLFAAVSAARLLHLDAEEEVSLAANRFIDRFDAMEKALVNEGMDIASVSADTWQRLWKQTSAE